ncbi:MAG: ECF transporter S component [Pseudoclavibacter sp.]
MASETHGEPEPESFDRIVGDLRALRDRAGVVSYAEIARRIGECRASEGARPAASTPARSTVYDTFKLGRARMNAKLVGEIAVALGEDDDAAATWVARCHEAQRHGEQLAAYAAIATPATPDPPNALNARTAPITLPEHPIPAPTFPIDAWPRRTLGTALALLVGCIAVNLAGNALVAVLGLALYLDMIGTAIAAILLGPWYGVAAALLGSVSAVAVHGPIALPFGLVSAAGALVWGYGVNRFGLGSSLVRFFGLCLLVAVVCTLVSWPIHTLGFHGFTGHAGDTVGSRLADHGMPLGLSVLQANLLISVADKLLAGFIALAVTAALHPAPPAGPTGPGDRRIRHSPALGRASPDDAEPPRRRSSASRMMSRPISNSSEKE